MGNLADQKAALTVGTVFRLRRRRTTARVFILVQTAHMAKEAAVTVRIPAKLKHQLEVQARRERRSLSAQVVVYLDQAIASQAVLERSSATPFLGKYAGSRLPSEADFAEVRAMLWGALGKERERRGS
ncbi:hypothetical protein ACFL5O_09470 [Myxococcota bacterium]